VRISAPAAFAAPAIAAENSVEQTGLIPVVTLGDSVAEQIGAQAAAQKQAAEQKAAEEAARKKAAEKAKEEREAKARAAREAERRPPYTPGSGPVPRRASAADAVRPATGAA
jgi:membrane protein involved in colicin uptake